MKECYLKIVENWCLYQIRLINRIMEENNITMKETSEELKIPYRKLSKILKGNIDNITTIIAIKLCVEHIAWKKEEDELPF